jgi:phage terminase small subunit
MGAEGKSRLTFTWRGGTLRAMAKLSEKQKRFVLEYIVDLNGTQAAIRAGYAENSAKQQASRLLTNDDVCAELAKQLKKHLGKAEITVEGVLADLQEIKQRCMQHIPVVDKLGHETGEYVFDSRGATRALELQGKYLKMFTDKVQHEGGVEIHVVTGVPDDGGTEED